MCILARKNGKLQTGRFRSRFSSCPHTRGSRGGGGVEYFPDIPPAAPVEAHECKLHGEAMEMLQTAVRRERSTTLDEMAYCLEGSGDPTHRWLPKMAKGLKDKHARVLPQEWPIFLLQRRGYAVAHYTSSTLLSHLLAMTGVSRHHASSQAIIHSCREHPSHIS